MLLKRYDKPDDVEMEAAFREVFYFIQNFSLCERVLVCLICRIAGDKLYALVAQKMHSHTMSTLQDVACGCHVEFFERKRKERAQIRNETRGFVSSTFVE